MSRRVVPARQDSAALPVLREERPRPQLHALQTLLLHFLCTRVRAGCTGPGFKRSSGTLSVKGSGVLSACCRHVAVAVVTGCGVCCHACETNVNHTFVSLLTFCGRFNVRLTKRLRALSAGSRSERPRPALNRAESVPGKPLLLRLVRTPSDSRVSELTAASRWPSNDQLEVENISDSNP